ncbi:hypothetical protein [Mycobacterium sp.]|uniref:hypothetical protein n=1 Tax=Mycobacterium sp. TaxID=1785 RepID=UPI003C775257
MWRRPRPCESRAHEPSDESDESYEPYESYEPDKSSEPCESYEPGGSGQCSVTTSIQKLPGRRGEPRTAS